MHTVTEALTAILENVKAPQPCRVAINDALGRILAEDIISEIDSPPFDKALMDGYAVRAADRDIATGEGLAVIEEVTAGNTATRPVGLGEATRIMTGAPIPEESDCVVPVELTQFDETKPRVRIDGSFAFSAEANIMRRATAMRMGDAVLPVGRTLRPQELGTLAELGVDRVPSRAIPTVAVLATGDELVEVGQPLGPGQIRNSNETMLVAQIRRAGGEPQPLGIARDNREDLRAKIEAGLKSDVLLLSGGVSAGKLDFVPSELEAAGVKQVFHKVNVKPGKPIWFGVLPGDRSPDSRPRYVFGLPGNPVSSMVCFEIFARTAIRRLMGDPKPAPQPIRAKLAETFDRGGDRDIYFPARCENNENGNTVHLANWHGSADLRSTVDANGLVVFPAGIRTFARGQIIDFLHW